MRSRPPRVPGCGCLVGVRDVRVDRRILWDLRPPRIPVQWRRVLVVAVGSGVLRRLDSRQEPIRINRSYAKRAKGKSGLAMSVSGL